MAQSGLMRAAVVAENRTLETRTLPRPEPGDGQVRVRVAACGICGSDLHMIRSPALPPGAILGHEFAGVIDGVGGGVDDFAIGDRVVVYPARPTAEHDLEAVLTTSIGGPSAQGAYAECAVVGREMLWRVPDDLKLEHAALVEPLAVALHGVDMGRVDAGTPCAVIGAGPIGLMVACALRARGIGHIVLVEKNPERRMRAEELGFQAVGTEDVHAAVPAALGGPPPRVFECAGHPSAPNLAIELVGVSGRVILMGFLEEHSPISQLGLMLKEAELCSTWAYRPANYDEAIELLRSGSIPADRLITGREPLENATGIFAELGTPTTKHIKVLLIPGEDA
jgi:(R,R)-butanediol dehydrogenase/meso-butanediol dehydrogenase/diacetyl reductase